MQTVKPAPNHLFCKPDEAETKTASGILIQHKMAEKPRTAEVINVGGKVQGYLPKDKIVYKAYSTTELKLEGKDYFLIADEDVLGTIVETRE